MSCKVCLWCEDLFPWIFNLLDFELEGDGVKVHCGTLNHLRALCIGMCFICFSTCGFSQFRGSLFSLSTLSCVFLLTLLQKVARRHLFTNYMCVHLLCVCLKRCDICLNGWIICPNGFYIFFAKIITVINNLYNAFSKGTNHSKSKKVITKSTVTKITKWFN